MSATVAEIAAAVEIQGIDQAERDLDTFGRKIDETGQKQQQSTQRSMAHDQALRKVGNTALITGGLIDAGMVLAIGTTMEFDKALSGVAAVSNATKGELDQLRTAAIEAGRDTAFSATDAATAEAELAKAGLSTAQILDGGLTGALSLAAAGQLDLADAATITAQALNIFKLDGGQASHVADVLAAGANKSAADVGQLGDALRQGGLLARQTGLDLEDTVGVLALFADNALIGSDAGTSLKTMLQRLTPQSAEAKAEMQRLGISAYDAQGNFVGLEKFAGNLRESLKGLTPEQRNAAMATIFGSDAVRAASLIYDAGAKGIHEYVTAVDDQGAASRMAGKQMDNLAGDIEQLRGSIETGLIQSGSGATKILRLLAEGATDVVNGFSNLDPAVQTGVAGLVAFSGIGLTAIGVGTKLVEKWGEWQKAAEAVSPALGHTVDGLGRVAAGAAIAGVSASMLGENSQAAGVGILGMAVAGGVMGSAFGPTGAAIGAATGLVAGLTMQLTDGGESVDDYRKKIGNLGSELDGLSRKQAFKRIVDELGDDDKLGLFAGDASAVTNEIVALGSKSPAAAANFVESLKAMRNEAGKPLYDEKNAAALDTALEKANGRYQDNIVAAKKASDTNKEYAGSALDAAGETSQFASELDSAKTSADNYKTTIDALLGVGLDVESANLRWRDSVDNITKSLLDNGATLDINTEAGRKNREALLGSTSAALNLAEAQFRQDQNMGRANQTIGLQIGALENAAHQMGLNDEQTLTYIEDLLNIPAEARTDIHNTADLARYAALLVEQKYNDLNGMSVDTPINATDNASPKIEDIRARLVLLTGQSWDVIVNAANNAAPYYGAHGLVGLAHGGSAGMIVGPNQPVVIGEGLSREAVVPFDNFGDMVATIRNTGRAGDFARAAAEAGGELLGGASATDLASLSVHGGDAASITNVVHMHVAGSVIRERDLVASMHEGLLRRGRDVGTLRFP